MADELYDRIGVGYADLRQPDPRLALAIDEALGSAREVVNVGAGAGSYEPRARRVVAVEPSFEMIRQRPPGSAPVVRASASSLPFRDDAFAAALSILSLHHWPDPRRGLEEMRRVSRERIVILTWDPDHPGFWLVRDYFPEILAIDRRIFPRMSDFESILGPIESRVLPIPWDCRDGFLGAYWRRPDRYLEPRVRAAISTFTKISEVERGLLRLRADLDSGDWKRRNATLADAPTCDLGYRLVVASGD
ncbi:MAG: methyltransferase domain-containing protein [Planctomycetes bacterium]|nr:methyltransferase domain-containing protein [Planctomycetota bacterium]